MKLNKIDIDCPLEEQILLYWEKSKHFEDGTLYIGDDGEVTHYLFDGECLNDEPSHWAYLPKVEK